ncbi:SPFH/Band 7/PHB domain protein [Patescibacteria group bacterium]|nr:SPFH/Band 7/PHB domain protein [Patescibacteria group bacterium]
MWPAEFLTGYALSQFADSDFFVTDCKEGQGKAIVTNGGSFVKLIMAFEGRHYNHPDLPGYDPSYPRWEVLDNDPSKPDSFYETRHRLLSEFGTHWIGIPGQRKLLSYHQEWLELSSDEIHYPDGIRKRIEETQIFIVNDFPYVVQDESFYTKDGLPIKVTYLLTLRINNPYIALFDTSDWLKQAESYASRAARSFLGSFSWRELLSETNEEDDKKRMRENFSHPIESLNTKLLSGSNVTEPVGMKRKIGVTVTGAELLSIELTGATAERNEETTLLVFRSEEEALARINAAEAEKREIELLAEANATRVRLDAEAIAHKTMVEGDATANALEAKLKAQNTAPELAEANLKYDAYATATNLNVIDVGEGASKKVAEVAKELLRPKE